MKKSELRQMIREVLKEELSSIKQSYIKEALDTYSKKERYHGIDDLVNDYNIKVESKLEGEWPKISEVFQAVRDDSSRDILIQVDKSVNIIEASKVLGALFVDFRFTTGYEDMFQDELFWVLEPSNNTIAFWHGRLDDMDIPSGLTDDDMDTSGDLVESRSNSVFYVTYQDSYNDSFTSYFVSDSNSVSLNHWQKDLQHFDELYTDDNTCLVRAQIELSGDEAGIFNAILNKEFNIRDKAAWVTADQLLDKLAKANMLQELDISYDYFKSGKTYVKY